MDDRSRSDKAKEIGITILEGIMGAFSVLVNPKEAAKKGQESTANRLGRWRKKRDLTKEFVGRYVLAYPNSSPANVIWGIIERVNVREAGEYDLVVRHLAHGYEQYVRNDNIYSIQFFESKEKLLTYVEYEIKKDNLREGSLRITAKGAMEYGTLILRSLREVIIKDDKMRSVIPENFASLISEAQEQFIKLDEKEIVFFSSKKTSELSSRFPLESLVVLSAINNVFMMRNLAIVSD